MPFKKNRNSRDDKSGKFGKSSKPIMGSPLKKNNRYKFERPEASNNIKGKLFGDDNMHSSESDSRKTSKVPERGNKKLFTNDRIRDNKKPYGNKNQRSERKPHADERITNDRKPYNNEGNPFREYDQRSGGSNSPKRYGDKPYKSRAFDKPRPEKTERYRSDDRKWESEERLKSNNRSKKPTPEKDESLIRLNRYIANAGICSRRKADELISAGVVSVNGETVTELGFKVDPRKDLIRYNGEVLKREKLVYVLLNKPKDYITTTDDPQERKTVMNLVEKASRERIYPVGRLDRNTTGLLLMTNDGDLAEKLSHPRNSIIKIYQVELNKNLSQGDLNKIAFGLELEDGLIKPDAVSYVQGGSKKKIGIQIHSGKNRVVRRIFEHLGYEVIKLDRVVYGCLTKKDLPRGRWRYLEEKEIIQLKHLIN